MRINDVGRLSLIDLLIREMISRLAARGWNNIKDMVLDIDFIGESLIDKDQDILYFYEQCEA